MLVSFMPNLVTNKYQTNNKAQNPSFRAVNKEWLAQILDEPGMAHNEYRFEFMMPKTKITLEEFVDTLEAAKERLGNGFKDSFNSTIVWAKKFKRD